MEEDGAGSGVNGSDVTTSGASSLEAKDFWLCFCGIFLCCLNLWLLKHFTNVERMNAWNKDTICLSKEVVIIISTALYTFLENVV